MSDSDQKFLIDAYTATRSEEARKAIEAEAERLRLMAVLKLNEQRKAAVATLS